MERDQTAFESGCDAARNDITAGRLVYRWGGHAGHWGHWIVTQLAERFGVSVNDGFGVCLVTKSSLLFDDGYNSVLVAEIDRRHGAGAFQSVLSESKVQSEVSLGDARRTWMEQNGMM